MAAPNKEKDISITTPNTAAIAPNPAPIAPITETDVPAPSAKEDPDAGKPANLLEKPEIKPIDVSGNWIKMSNDMINDITHDLPKESSRLLHNLAKRLVNDMSPAQIEENAEYYKDKPERLAAKSFLLGRIDPELKTKFDNHMKESITTLQQKEAWDTSKPHEKTQARFESLTPNTQNAIINRPDTQKEIDAYINTHPIKNIDDRLDDVKNKRLSPEAFQGLKNRDNHQKPVNDIQSPETSPNPKRINPQQSMPSQQDTPIPTEPELTPTSPGIAALHTGIAVAADVLSVGSQQVAQNEKGADQAFDDKKENIINHDVRLEALEQKITTKQEIEQERLETQKTNTTKTPNILMAHGSTGLDTASSPTGPIPLNNLPQPQPTLKRDLEPTPEPRSALKPIMPKPTNPY